MDGTGLRWVPVVLNPFPYVILYNPHPPLTLPKLNSYSHFTNEKTEAQRS